MNRIAEDARGIGFDKGVTAADRRRRFLDWIPAPALEFAHRIRHLFDRRREDAEMDEELQFHLEMEAAQLARSGVPGPEARRTARLAFGGVDGHRERIREARGLPPLEDFWRDVKYAGRSFWRDRTFTVVAIAILGIGLGAASGVMAFINFVAIEPLPGIQHPEQAARVTFLHQANWGVYETVRGKERVAYLDAQNSFVALGGADYGYASLAMEAGDRVEQVEPDVIVGEYFEALRLDMTLGRGLVGAGPEDAQAVVLSHELWTTHFAASPAVVGRVIRLNAQPMTIVGVGPEGFPSRGDLWLTRDGEHLVSGDNRPRNETDRSSEALFGRLKPGISREEAAAEARAIAATFDEILTKDRWDSDAPVRGARVGPPTWLSLADGAQAIALLAGLTLLILAVVGANLGVLLLGRAMARRQEISVRLALGASRARLVRQLLTEGVVLAILGALAAVAGIRAASEIRLSIQGTDLALVPTWQTSAATIALAAIIGVLFSVAPALHATVGSLRNAMTDSAAAGSRRSVRLQRGLVAGAFAIAGGLASVAGLIVIFVFQTINPTAENEISDRVGLITLRPHFLGYVRGQMPDLAARLTENLSRVPGVESVAWASAEPGRSEGYGIHVPGFGVPYDERVSPPVLRDFAGPGYFRTLGIPLTAGREFLTSDDESAPPVVVISEELAERLWPGLDPIGRTLEYERVIYQQEPVSHQALVVGVTPAAGRRGGGTEDGVGPSGNSRPVVFFAEQQRQEDLDSRGSLTLMVRSRDDLNAATKTRLLSVILAAEPDLVVADIKTTRERHWELHDQELVGAYAAAIGGAVILLIAAVGLYGVITFRLDQRRRELAITRALGAGEGRVVFGAFREGMLLTAGGLGLGLAISLFVVRYLLFGAFIPGAAAVVTLALFAVACLACWLPARRAARIQPMEALRA